MQPMEEEEEARHRGNGTPHCRQPSWQVSMKAPCGRMLAREAGRSFALLPLLVKVTFLSQLPLTQSHISLTKLRGTFWNFMKCVKISNVYPILC